MFRVVDAYFYKNGMKWEKLVGVCTDGAPAMLGCRSGFFTRVEQKNSDAVGSHCIIYREALASKTLPAAMKKKLAIIIRIVNFIKSSAVNFRLFSQLYKNVGSVAIRTLLSFSSTYLCESGFSALVSMKTKFRNKLECEADLRCTLSSTKPRIKQLLIVSQKQLHPSH